VAFAPELKAFSSGMSNGSGNFGPSRNYASQKTASLTHVVSWSPASHSRQNDVIAAAPTFPSEGQITSGMPFLLKSIQGRHSRPITPLHSG